MRGDEDEDLAAEPVKCVDVRELPSSTPEVTTFPGSSTCRPSHPPIHSDVPNHHHHVVDESGCDDSSEDLDEDKHSVFFLFMADFPWPFLLVIPIAFALLAAFGWSRGDIVQEHLDLLWVDESSSFAQGKTYGERFGMGSPSFSVFLAMAISRDGGNIMTAERLEEVRARMEATEATTIEHDGVTYTWDDLCAENVAPYELPCLRLSAMDLFLESRWTFSKNDRVKYFQTIRELLLEPRTPRYGIMSSECAHDACVSELAYRMDRESVGYDPLSIFKDIGDLEYNHPCRICIEDGYSNKIKELHSQTSRGFHYLRNQVEKARDILPDNNENGATRMQLEDVAAKLALLEGSITKDDIVDFYYYYVVRQLYAQFGSDTYIEFYASYYQELFGQFGGCELVGPVLGVPCPPEHVNETTARQHLLNHADNTFSSVNTGGAPFPLWSDGVGTGALLKPNQDTGTLLPISGSGINMSAPLLSLYDYFTYLYLQAEPVDINSEAWHSQVETNPLYSWFMASLTTAEEGTMCGNGDLPGTDTGVETLDDRSASILANDSNRWCTPYDVPNDINTTLKESTASKATRYSKQHFARLWYDLTLSRNFLEIVQGEDDPYSYTVGSGCGYDLGGERFSYMNKTEQDILHNASRLVYNVDEGSQIGAVDRSLLIGGATPRVGEYDFEHPLDEVLVLQTIYAALDLEGIAMRIQNCHRTGGPVFNITQADAEMILLEWKEAMEEAWSMGWNNATDGEVQFVSFFDEYGGVIGSTGRMLNEMTLDNGKLLTVAVAAISVFSVLFYVSANSVESRVLLVLVGVGLVVLAYFAGVGFSLLVTDVKVNVAVTWFVPFVIIGLGVDDVYIILNAIKMQEGYAKIHWLRAMEEVAVPVAMTSLVNASMMAIMNLSSVPAVYETGRVMCFSIIGLYLSVICCFPAYCYFDLKRQGLGRKDILFCVVSSNPPLADGQREDVRYLIYDKFYKPIILAPGDKARKLVHLGVLVVSSALLAYGAWGIKEHDIGIGLEDFFPASNPSGRWASLRTEELATWPIGMDWGPINYTDPYIQMKMIQQFEGVQATSKVAQVDTKQLWIADFALWTSRHCTHNFDRDKFEEKKCGRDQVFHDVESGEDSFCTATWVPNVLGLRQKHVRNPTDQTCRAHEGGICRPTPQMHPDDLLDMGLNASSRGVFCPVIQDWSEKKWKFCLRTWRNLTRASHRFVLENKTGSPTNCSGVYNQDQDLRFPLPITSSPTLFAVDLFSHQITLDMIRDTRAVCDDDKETVCWMTGIPFEYWSQYEDIFSKLVALLGYGTVTAFVTSTIFLFGQLFSERHHSLGQIFVGSLVGASLIALTILCTLVTVVGCSMQAGVNLTGFSNLAFMLSIGFTVEYSVHIVSRWLHADLSKRTSLARVDHTMSFLVLPTFMSFVSSTIGVLCMAFTEFEFERIYLFRPLIIVMPTSYWFGCWLLPVLLAYMDWDVVKLGRPAQYEAEEGAETTQVGLKETEGKPPMAVVYGGIPEPRMECGKNQDETEDAMRTPMDPKGSVEYCIGQ